MFVDTDTEILNKDSFSMLSDYFRKTYRNKHFNNIRSVEKKNNQIFTIPDFFFRHSP